jgi:hypothetical protein
MHPSPGVIEGPAGRTSQGTPGGFFLFGFKKLSRTTITFFLNTENTTIGSILQVFLKSSGIFNT